MIMKRDTMEEFPVYADHTIVKRKRTKRRRSSSAAAESHDSLFYSSPATSSGISRSTEEDEDMANCLILLARGDSPPPDPPLAAEAGEKFSSRVFREMGPTCDGRVGIYVYECKTCNRTFPSFQALGGHRASHKKPKPTQAAVERIEDDRRISKINSPPQPNKLCQTNDQIRPRIHECSICGSEFASGQALGGHMRRHRTTAPPPIAGDNDSWSEDAIEKPRSLLALDLDLNQPAPPELDKFSQFPAPQQPRMTFTEAAALVDCHY